ncbi:MAG: hypothetical protein NDI60_05170 [Elusimicrobiales bacterium]|nr:hypothetical protein [Elusimicrobiales bacterium]
MTNKYSLVLALLLLAPLTAPLRAADEEAAEAKAALNRTEALLEEIDCYSKKGELFFEYLKGGVPAVYKFRCAKGRETMTAPAWLAGEVSSMTAREVQVNKETWNEARLWREPLAALDEFSELVRKTRPAKTGGLGLPHKFLYPACTAALTRLDKALAALRRERLAGSFGGRGDAVFASFAKALAELDALEKTYDVGSPVTFYEKAAAVLRNQEEALAALFADAPARRPENGAFSADYFAAPRQQAGSRLVPMAFPAWQLEGLKRGDRVDLMVTYENAGAGGAKDLITATIIQAAPVMYVSKADASGQGMVRLILTPVQAQYAALAAVQGRDLRLAARCDGDAESRALEAASFKKIIK